MSEKLRMDAYYYSFEPTGVLAVDRILSAVASAGKGSHHTAEWNEPMRDGKSAVEMIQDAANAAAAEFRNPAPPSPDTVQHV